MLLSAKSCDTMLFVVELAELTQDQVYYLEYKWTTKITLSPPKDYDFKSGVIGGSGSPR